MAEERICVRRIPNPCNSCNIKPCTRKCIFSTLYEKDRYSMTRAEVIERMKDADIRNHWECQKQGRRPTDDERYSAMLDALLERE